MHALNMQRLKMRETFKRSRVLSILAAVQVLQLVLVSANHDPMGRTMNDCTLTLDVRRPADYWQGHLDCSLNFPRCGWLPFPPFG